MRSPHLLVPAVLATVILAGTSHLGHASEPNVVLQWNSTALEAVRRSTLPPPAVARALAIVHTCMYDAWAVYDPVARGCTTT